MINNLSDGWRNFNLSLPHSLEDSDDVMDSNDGGPEGTSRSENPNGGLVPSVELGGLGPGGIGNIPLQT